MKCAIMQPTYLPWLGYFKMMNQVDTFVFLDDIQFAKRSWQQRNKIALHNQEKILTIPCITKGLRHQKINEVYMDLSTNWKSQHHKTIEQAYRNYPYFSELEYILEFYNEPTNKLSEFTIALIKETAKNANITPEFILSSELKANGSKSAYLLNICNELGATEYVSAAGSKQYIEDEALFAQSDIFVTYEQSEPFIYKQFNEKPTIPYLSFIDYIANQGFLKMEEIL
ncbi:WbqC family protein [Lysinibacillus sp. NPDC096418]|uniref:WbqC family protein n=1 Tax=Lysinibacillus sp. NPDC096418 TaxID=3364138 RepID=UPI00382B111A